MRLKQIKMQKTSLTSAASSSHGPSILSLFRSRLPVSFKTSKSNCQILLDLSRAFHHFPLETLSALHQNVESKANPISKPTRPSLPLLLLQAPSQGSAIPSFQLLRARTWCHLWLLFSLSSLSSPVHHTGPTFATYPVLLLLTPSTLVSWPKIPPSPTWIAAVTGPWEAPSCDCS